MKLPQPVVHFTRSALGSTGRPPPRPPRPPTLKQSQQPRTIHTSARAAKEAATILEDLARTIAQISTHTVKPVRSITLGANFRALLAQVAPIFRNAVATSPAYARGIQTATFTFSQEASRSGSQIAQQAARTARMGFGGSGIGRTSRIPTVPRSTAYGPGLQTARSFSTGGAGNFNSVANNVPLILRALGNELDEKKGAGKTAGAGGRATPRRMSRSLQTKLARSEVRRVSASRNKTLGEVQNKPVKRTAAAAAVAAVSKAEKMSNSEIKDGLAEYFVPVVEATDAASVVYGPHMGVTTTLNVALDPDLRTILCAATLGTSELGIGVAGDPLVDSSFSTALLETRRAYREHAVLLKELLDALGKDTIVESVRVAQGYDESTSLILRSLSDEDLLRNIHAMALRVEFAGWTAEEVRQMLDERLGNDLGRKLRNGSFGGCSLREVRVGGTSYGEISLAFPQLDLSLVEASDELPFTPSPQLSLTSLGSASLPSTPSMSDSDILSLVDFEEEPEVEDDLQDSRFF